MRNLQAKYSVKEPSDIHKVKTNLKWQYVTRIGDEAAMAFYMKFRDVPGANNRIGNRVRELMDECEPSTIKIYQNNWYIFQNYTYIYY